MNLQTCIKKLGYVGTLAFATVDEHGSPQVRNVSAIHYEEDAIYFYTAQRAIEEGKTFHIIRENCLHCGMCAKVCPVSAIERL